MLIFKKNIACTNYSLLSGSINLEEVPNHDLPFFNPVEFIKQALEEDESLLNMVAKQPTVYHNEDLMRFYPKACKFSNLKTIKKLVEILYTGIDCKTPWYKMNTYHFCVLYDILFRFSYNYNRDPIKDRKESLPNLDGNLIPFNRFIKEYYFNTVFLLTADQFNNITPDEKKKKGYCCHCQFGAINGLLPTREEMELKESKDYPYTIYV
tara:strand:- start:132 stop:758 length:627 start_codon:yes stop_codon:yes gene_type:complete